MFSRTSHVHSVMFTRLTLIGQAIQYLAGVKHLIILETCHLLLRGLSFSLMGHIAPSVYVTESGLPT
jgi:hypothetical protein